MRRLFDIGFLVLIALGCVGLDFYILKRDSKADHFGVADYIAQRGDDFNDILHPPSLASALPSDIAGWDIAKSGADKMVGVTDANRQAQANEVALVKAVAALAKASAPKGEMLGMTMTKGETRLRVVAMLVQQDKAPSAPEGIETIAQAAPKGSATDSTASSAVLASLLKPNELQTDRAVFDVVDGVAFTELPLSEVTSDPDMRMMRATLSDALAVTVVTRSDDDTAIKEALQGIDFVMLNKLLNAPVAGVQEGRKTDLRLDHGAMPIATAQPDVLPAKTADGGAQAIALNDQGKVEAVAGASAETTAQTTAAQTTAAKPAAPQQAAQQAAQQAPPEESAVFITPPEQTGSAGGQPCVRRAGVLVCPDG